MTLFNFNIFFTKETPESEKRDFIKGREKIKSNYVLTDILRFLIPILILFTGLMLSTQSFAKMMNYDPSFCGKPWLCISGKNIYNPLIYFGGIFKYLKYEQMHPYLLSSCKYFVEAGFVSVIIIFVWGIIRQINNNIENAHGTARLATKKDLKKAGLYHTEGIVCGQEQKAMIKADRSKSTNLVLHIKFSMIPYISLGHLLCHNGNANTLLTGMTGDGKGVAFIIPSLLSYLSSMIIYDPKGENYEITAGWRSTFSHVIKFAPVDKGRRTIRFNPIMEIRDDEDLALRDADIIADILFAPPKGGRQDATNEYFSQSARDLVVTAILHLRFCPEKTKKSLAGLLDFLSFADPALFEKNSEGEDTSTQGDKQCLEMYKSSHYINIQTLDENGKYIFIQKKAEKIHRQIVNGAARLKQTNPKEKASVFKTVFSKIQLYADPILAEATSGSDFQISDFIESDRPISLYLVIPYSDVQRTSMMIHLIVTFMLKKFSEGETKHGSVKLKNHLVMLLDEFPTLGAFPEIAENMGVLRGYGVNFFIIAQDLKQLNDVYGENNPFIDHCAVKLIMAPNDPKTAQLYSNIIGQENINQHKVSSTSGIFNTANSLNRSENDFGRALFDPSEIMRIPGNQHLVLAHETQPYLAKKVVWYEDKRFKYKGGQKKPETQEELFAQIADLPSVKRRKEIKRQFESMPVKEFKGIDERELFEDEDEALIQKINEFQELLKQNSFIPKEKLDLEKILEEQEKAINVNFFNHNENQNSETDLGEDEFEEDEDLF